MSARESIAALTTLLGCFAAKPQWNGEKEFTLHGALQPVPFSLLREFDGSGIVPAIEDGKTQHEFDLGNDGQVAIGISIAVRVPRQWDTLAVARDFGSLLVIPRAMEDEPVAYIILEWGSERAPISFVSGDKQHLLPVVIQRYHQALELWTLLKKQAHHVQPEGHLLFFFTRRMEIAPGFGQSELENQLWVPPIMAFVNNEDRQETRQEIFVAALSELLRDQAPDKAFGCLLRSTNLFTTRLKEGMAIYLSEHSPEKLAAEALASAITLSDSLEKIIGGLEAKALSIPAALLLAVKEIKPGGCLDALNVIIIMSLVSFATTMLFIHRSQSDLIEQLLQTIKATIEDLKRKGLDKDSSVLKGRFQGLEKRAARAKSGSLTMCWASWMPLACVAYVAFFGHPPVAPPK